MRKYASLLFIDADVKLSSRSNLFDVEYSAASFNSCRANKFGRRSNVSSETVTALLHGSKSLSKKNHDTLMSRQ